MNIDHLITKKNRCKDDCLGLHNTKNVHIARNDFMGFIMLTKNIFSPSTHETVPGVDFLALGWQTYGTNVIKFVNGPV